PEVFLDVLFADPAHRDDPSGTVGQRRAEELLAQEDAFAVVPQGAMAEVGDVGLGFVEPVVDRQIIFDPTAPAIDARQGVMIWMHGRYSSTSSSSSSSSRNSMSSSAWPFSTSTSQVP